MIQLGDSGDYVRAWQRIVGTRADGAFGPGTDAAVRAWQQARGVDPDGVIGPLTRAAVLPGDLIKPNEGCLLFTYDDKDDAPLHLVGSSWRRPDDTPASPSLARGVPTIGWGDTEPPRRGISSCTRAEADAWLLARLGKTFSPAVERYRGADWDEAAAEAARCFAYNCGTGALAALSGRGFQADAWLSWDKVRGVQNAGLAERRREEFALFSAA